MKPSPGLLRMAVATSCITHVTTNLQCPHTPERYAKLACFQPQVAEVGPPLHNLTRTSDEKETSRTVAYGDKRLVSTPVHRASLSRSTLPIAKVHRHASDLRSLVMYSSTIADSHLTLDSGDNDITTSRQTVCSRRLPS